MNRYQPLGTVGVILGVVFALVGAVRAEEEPMPELLPAPAPEAGVDRLGDPLPPRALARLGSARLRHGSYISFLGFSPDNKEIVTRDGSGLWRVWSAADGKEVRTFGGLTPANVVYGTNLLSADGRFLAGAGAPDRVLRLWEVASGKELWAAPGNAYAMPLAFGRDGTTLLTRGNTGEVQLRDATNGKELWQTKLGPQARLAVPVFAPDGKSVALKSNDGSLKLLDAATGQPLPHFTVQLDIKKFVMIYGAPVFSPDGKLLATACAERRDNQFVGVVHIWETESGRELRQMNGPADGRRAPVPAFTPDFRAVAWAAQDGTIRLHDLETGKETRKIGEPQPERAASGTPMFSPDGKVLLWRTLTGNSVAWDLDADKEIVLGSNGPGLFVGTLAFAADGKTLAATMANYSVRLWDLPSGKERFGEGNGHAGNILALALSPDGQTATSIGGDRTLRRWEVSTGRELLQVSLGQTARFNISAVSPDGRTAAIGLFKDNVFNTIELWDTAAGKPTRQIEVDQPLDFASLSFSADSKTLLARDRSATLRLWEASSGKVVAQVVQQATGTDQSIGGRGALSPDGKVVASVWTLRNLANNRNSYEVRLWQVSTGKLVGRIPLTATFVSNMAFAPDGRTLAVIHNNLVAPAARPAVPNYSISLYEVASGKERCQWTPEGRANALAFAPDGRSLAVGFMDGMIRLLSVQTGQALGQLKGHHGTVQQLVFAANGRQLLTGGSDGSPLLWDPASVIPPPAASAGELTTAQLDALWTELAGDDAGKAYRALGTLTADPAKVVPWLRERLKPAVGFETVRIDKLIADLDSDKFAVRQQAADELEKLGELAVPALEKVLETKPSLNVRQRVDELLGKVTTFQVPADVLHAIRAVEVLERIGTPEAKQVVESLAKGAPGARLTQNAQRTSDRLRPKSDKD
jgi:WD40 repeat protein